MKPLLFAISLFISWQLAATESSTEQKQAQPASVNEPEKKEVDSLEFIEQKSVTQQVPSSVQDKKPLAKVDDSKVLGSQNPAPAEQPKTAEEKQEAVNEAEQAVAKAKKALTEKQQEKARQSREATAVIEQVIAAYNARNIDAFIKMYDENVEFYTFPNELMFTGKEKLIARYGIMFKKLKCIKSSPIKRIVHGNIVIDHELSETCSEDPNVVDKRAEFVTSYQIENGKITKVLFFR